MIGQDGTIKRKKNKMLAENAEVGLETTQGKGSI
jgi:hypothetical protein